MKKLKVIFLSLAVSTALVSNSFGQTLTLTYDGSVHKYTGDMITLKVNGVVVSTDIPPVIIDGRSLVPARALFEKLGALVKWDEPSKKVTVSLKETDIALTINDKNAVVNKKSVKMDVPAKIINDRTMIPVRFVSEQLGAKVGWYPEEKLITINNENSAPVIASLNKIECYPKGDNDLVTLYVENYKDSKIFKLEEPERIVIDLPNTSLLVAQKPDVAGSQIKSVRYSQFEESTARVVLDVLNNTKYKVEETADKIIVSVSRPTLTGRGDDVREETPRTDASATLKPTPLPTLTPVHTETPIATGTSVPTVTPNPGDLTIKYSTVDGRDEISLIVPSYKDYKVVRYTDPDKIVIDIPNAKTQVDQQTININSKLIKNIRYSMFDGNTARVVLDVVGQPSYRTQEGEGLLVVAIESPTYKNLSYHNNGDRVGLILPGVKLTEGEEYLKRLYTGSYDEEGKNYTITFPKSQGDIGYGSFIINDSVLKSIEINNDTSTGMTSITFEAEDKFFYEVITRSNAGNTAITIMKPAKEGEKLVVIDPGHGGFEPGAESSGILEKDLNLDISMKLNKLLKDKGIRTYIIREDDSYIGLYERAYIANNLNASLFICIHNNAYYAKENGTETLYYPNRSNSSGFTGKRFAQIIQNNLVSTLGTTNRGIVERPNLVVLKATTMPAALAEIAFMTNSGDLAKLQDDNFRLNAAAALCNSVIQALSEIN